jgi:hypothetical protein
MLEFQAAAQLAWIEAGKIVCKAEGGGKLVDIALVELAKSVGVDQARELENHFRSQEFRDTCDEVFQRADADASGKSAHPCVYVCLYIYVCVYVCAALCV